MAIHFFNEESNYKLKLKSELKQWIKAVAAEEGFKIAALNYILCSDEYLHQINVTYLQHDTFTDIITFDHSEKKDSIAGDIFLSTKSTLLKSEYNTYRKYGLPPGPIGNPGFDAMFAAASAAPGDWIYFVTVAPGDTRFTASYDQFSSWKIEYKKNLRAGLFGSSK